MTYHHFTRLQDSQKLRTTTLAELLGFQDPAAERWLFVSAHDDDITIGGGLWVEAAVRAGLHVEVLIVTDGRMGYCSAAEQANIVPIRREETFRSFEILGVPRSRVEYIGYPDDALFTLQGRRQAQPGELARYGHVGLHNEFTFHLRRVRPNRVFVPSAADLHPDHRITYHELLMSIFHAQGAIWPELGPPSPVNPTLYEMAVYCDFDKAPNLELRGSPEAFEKKLQSIAAYKSQAQIDATVQTLRAAGPYEYLRETPFPIYSPAHYRPLFE